MSTSSSPIYGQQDLITFDVLVGPSAEAISDVYYIDSIEVSHRLNGLSRARLTLYDGSPAKQEFENKESNDFLPGNEIIINLGYHRDNEEIFRGMVLSTSIKVKSGQHTRLEVDCVAQAYKMTIGRKNKYFLKSKDSDIISNVISEYGSKPEKGSVEATTFQYEEVIQYNCTDWDFILSRAEINGLVVDTSDNKVNVVKPNLSGTPPLNLTFGIDLISTNLKLDGSYQLQAVDCSSWDMKQQKLNTGSSQEPSMNDQGDSSSSGKSIAKEISPSKLEMHTSAPLEQSVLKNWANAQLLKSRLSRIQGTVKCQGSFDIKPNQLVRLDGLGSYFNGDGFVSAVHHTIEAGNWTSELTLGMSPDWFVESRPNVMAPAAAGLLPGISGLYIGKVKKIDQDPEGETRIQVDIPVIAASGDGVWARLTSPYATNKKGFFFIPEVGDEVILGFLQNDPTFPIIVGSLYSSKNAPPYTPDKDNSTKAIVTKNDLRLIFEDKEKNIIIKTPAGNEINISDQDGSIVIKDKNQNKITMDNSGIELNSPKDITLKATGKITLDATQKVEIKSKSSDVALSGLNVKADAKIKVSSTGNMAELKGNATTEIKGGIVRIN